MGYGETHASVDLRRHHLPLDPRPDPDARPPDRRGGRYIRTREANGRELSYIRGLVRDLGGQPHLWL
jgi:hypothetical protein